MRDANIYTTFSLRSYIRILQIRSNFHYLKYRTFSTLGSLLEDKNLCKTNFNGEFEFFLRYFLSLSFNFSHPKLESNLFSTQNDISPPLLHNYADIQIEKEVDRVVAGVYRNIA